MQERFPKRLPVPTLVNLDQGARRTSFIQRIYGTVPGVKQRHFVGNDKLRETYIRASRPLLEYLEKEEGNAKTRRRKEEEEQERKQAEKERQEEERKRMKQKMEREQDWMATLSKMVRLSWPSTDF